MRLKDFSEPIVFATPRVGGVPAVFMLQRRLWFSCDQERVLRRMLAHYHGGHPISTLWPVSDCPFADDDEASVA